MSAKRGSSSTSNKTIFDYFKRSKTSNPAISVEKETSPSPCERIEQHGEVVILSNLKASLPATGKKKSLSPNKLQTLKKLLIAPMLQ